MRTPASRPISAANIPPQLTTISHSTSPRSVRTPLTRPPSVAMPTTRVCWTMRTPFARAAGRERVAQLRRVEVAVGLEVRRTDDAVEIHEREALGDLGRRDLVQRQVVGPGPTHLPADLVQPFGRGRQLDPAGLGPADRVLAALQLSIQLDRVDVHARERRVGAQLADQAGRVERRATRQLGPLDDQDVTLAQLGQVVGDARPADAAADHDDPRRGGQVGGRHAPNHSPDHDGPQAQKVCPLDHKRRTALRSGHHV